MASFSEECRFLDCFKRKRVKITLLDTQVIAVIQRINLNKTVILEDVYEVQTGRKFPGVKLIFGHDIVKVELHFPVSHANLCSVDDAHKTTLQSLGNRTILDDIVEHEDSMNYVLIDELQEKFGPAVTHIQEQKVIGIGANFFGPVEQERLCWLQVATKNVVYIFDILLLGARAFKNGLCMILEKRHILKVADLMLFYKDTGGFLPDRVSTLQEVVRIHLKVPVNKLSPLWIQEQCTEENPEVWYIRPCPPVLLKIMAVSVVHLLPLRLVLLDALMSDYTTLVDSYMSSYQNKSVHMLHDGKQNGVELPEEIQELEAVRQERIKWASRCYLVTDDGLLDRSSFKS
ncbi:piRNA biogenesis protein EXD1 isoform X3 [Paramisgurnus dabryanus]|uniref:piRNA biogenesis protein EXD1 isoform X3 n=1 Tax=Paramisgurnus dabryanus TaxID=90735 RepID=UPI003CCF9EA2